MRTCVWERARESERARARRESECTREEKELTLPNNDDLDLVEWTERKCAEAVCRDGEDRLLLALACYKCKQLRKVRLLHFVRKHLQPGRRKREPMLRE